MKGYSVLLQMPISERNLESRMTMRTFSPTPRTLMGPGPSDVHPRVLATLSRPTIGHLDPQFLSNESQERTYHHTAPVNALYGLHEALHGCSPVTDPGFPGHLISSRLVEAGNANP